MNEQDILLIRPDNVDSYVGQEQIKLQLLTAIVSARQRNDALPHILMAGPPGLGKTSLARVIALEMGGKIIVTLATTLDSEKALEGLLNSIPAEGYDQHGNVQNGTGVMFPIVFIDEIHRLKSKVTEALHSVLEDFTFAKRVKDRRTGEWKTGMYWVPRFTMIGATNYLGNLPKPFVDRFPIHFQFEVYTDVELATIVRQSAAKLGLQLEQDADKVIATKCRGIPRIANHFLLRCRDVALAFKERYNGVITRACVEHTMHIQMIDEHGLSRADRNVLEFLKMADRPIGLSAIAHGVDVDRKTVESVIEPWLVRKGLILKTDKGRIITDAGLTQLSGNVHVKDRRIIQP